MENVTEKRKNGREERWRERKANRPQRQRHNRGETNRKREAERKGEVTHVARKRNTAIRHVD